MVYYEIKKDKNVNYFKYVQKYENLSKKKNRYLITPSCRKSLRFHVRL